MQLLTLPERSSDSHAPPTLLQRRQRRQCRHDALAEASEPLRQRRPHNMQPLRSAARQLADKHAVARTNAQMQDPILTLIPSRDAHPAAAEEQAHPTRGQGNGAGDGGTRRTAAGVDLLHGRQHHAPTCRALSRRIDIAKPGATFDCHQDQRCPAKADHRPGATTEATTDPAAAKEGNSSPGVEHKTDRSAVTSPGTIPSSASQRTGGRITTPVATEAPAQTPPHPPGTPQPPTST